eukprot:3940496-Rhodomonas_salina.2
MIARHASQYRAWRRMTAPYAMSVPEIASQARRSIPAGRGCGARCGPGSTIRYVSTVQCVARS